MSIPALALTPEQEAEAQKLAARITEVAQEDVLQLARLLVSKPDSELFGATEYQVRDLVHQLGARAYQERLAEKKTATSGPARSARRADRPPSSRAIGRRSR
jgi:hypothetical protein